MHTSVPSDNGICFCRGQHSDHVVSCSNVDCPYSKFHITCLSLNEVPKLKTWYCPHCSRIPQFKRSRSSIKGKQPSAVIQAAILCSSICICNTKANPMDRLLECHGTTCGNGHFFSFELFGVEKNAKQFQDNMAVRGLQKKQIPNSKSVKPTTSTSSATYLSPVTPVATASRVSSDSGSDSEDEIYITKETTGTVKRFSALANLEDLGYDLINATCSSPVATASRVSSDSGSDSKDEICITKETTGTVNKFSALANLEDSDYDLINDSHGWLTCDIVQAAQVLIQEVNSLLEGLQRPTLGRVRNFDVVSGEFIQILHTGSDHWVCISSIGCFPGMVHLYDSLFHDVISQEIEDQTNDLLGGSLVALDIVSVQQQTNDSDCGVFAIAFATSLAFGTDPKHVTFDTCRMRPHLAACLKDKKLSTFPVFNC